MQLEKHIRFQVCDNILIVSDVVALLQKMLFYVCVV